MDESVAAKSSFDSFDADFIKSFDFDGKVEDNMEKCASTQECSDYQKVNFEKNLKNKVNFNTLSFSFYFKTLFIIYL